MNSATTAVTLAILLVFSSAAEAKGPPIGLNMMVGVAADYQGETELVPMQSFEIIESCLDFSMHHVLDMKSSYGLSISIQSRDYEFALSALAP